MRHICLYSFLFLSVVCPFTKSRAQDGFGAINSLSEKLVHQRWQTQNRFNALAGVSLIGAQWRGLVLLNWDFADYPFAGRLRGSMRQGPLGRYTPDWDEAYDLLRIIQFARIRTDNLYVRLGPIKDMRLGIGHIVNHYNSSISWDMRTVGTELAWTGGPVEVSGFSSDVRLNDVFGGRASLELPYDSKLGINYTNHDRTDLTAWSIDLQVAVFETGRIVFAPYASYAWYTRHGDGLAFGADVHSAGFLDLLSFKLRVGAFYNSRHFIPGYVGQLFAVSNSHNRIIRNEADLDDLAQDDFAGITLGEARGVNDLLTAFSLQIRESFWVEYSWRRHFGPQPLSELHFRLFVKRGPYFILEVGVDRLGERTFLGIFNPFAEQSGLTFATTLHIRKAFFLHTEARYTFEPIESSPHYLVQKRFEPLVGIRVNL